MYEFSINSIFGLDQASANLTFVHIIARTLLVYFGGVFLVRSHNQFLTMTTPFNYMINFLVGSLLANAIVGQGPFFYIVGICLFIYMINFIFELMGYFSPALEIILRRSSVILVKDGAIIWKNMRRNLVTHDQLMQAVRAQLHQNSLKEVKEAYYENNGSITIVKG